MGTSSARPSDLERFASRSRGADDQAQTHERRLRSAYAEFLSGTHWGALDISSMLAGLQEWLDWNAIDARWVARIAATFRAAGGDGAIKTLPDAAIHASLKAAGLLGGRRSITFDDPVAYGFPPTSGYTNDPVNTASGNFVEEETDLPFTGLLSGLRFGRVYNSRSDRVGAFGPGWSSWADARLRFVAEGVEYIGPDGQRALFPRMGEGYGCVLGVDALVEQLPGGVALAWFSGERWEFDEAGLPAVLTRGPGTDIRLQHEDGRLVSLAHAGGARTRVDWDGERIAGLLSTDGRRVSYRYDDAGNLVGAGSRRYEIDDGGHVASVIDADGVAEVVNAYDEDGRVIAQLSPFGRHTLIGYLPGAVTVTTDEQGGPDNIYIHDEHGRLQAVIDGEGARLAINYDEWGNPVAVTDRKGAVTVSEWDERARLLRSVAPGGSQITLAHDDLDRVVEVAERRTGAVTRLTYDGEERAPAAVTDPDGGVTRMMVEGGLVRSVVDPDGVELSFEFDADGNVVASTDGDGNVTRIERDAAGLPAASVSPLGRRTTFTYDDGGRLVERQDPGGAVWRYEYSAAGRPIAVVDPTGAREEVRYGARPDGLAPERDGRRGRPRDRHRRRSDVRQLRVRRARPDHRDAPARRKREPHRLRPLRPARGRARSVRRGDPLRVHAGRADPPSRRAVGTLAGHARVRRLRPAREVPRRRRPAARIPVRRRRLASRDRRRDGCGGALHVRRGRPAGELRGTGPGADELHVRRRRADRGDDRSGLRHAPVRLRRGRASCSGDGRQWRDDALCLRQQRGADRGHRSARRHGDARVRRRRAVDERHRPARPDDDDRLR
jgi:YD repeat-containing protein